MPPARIEPTSPESSSSSSPSHSEPPPATVSEIRRFANLRGVQWRIDLGVLPFSDTSSIDDLRRATADSRRRYATLRRRLLVDPHIPKDGSNSPDLVMDNPLSQNPDSMWGRFFRSAELERMVDQDLSRLYPEHGSYFQTPACQGMLRRILLLWCLRHPEYGYRQGMHELMAPLLYVLHVDIENLSEVRKLYEDHFIDKFDGFSFNESDLTYRFDFKKLPESVTDEIGPRKTPTKASTLDELDPNIQSIVMLSDAYGAEGELGIVISDKFMEHDAYCLFDALMNGSGSGAVAMAEFFSPSPLSGSHTGLPPVLEASSALYHLLSIVDSSLHSHLVELGVEPQYFALRWLRVLFGREFALEDLLMIWDEIFACDNKKRNDDVIDDVIIVLNSLRGGFISALAVSMILYLRSSLLATENATSCLQRLLNFPEDINIEKLIEKAKSLQDLAMDANNSAPLPMNTVKSRGHSLSADSPSGSPAGFVPESYWEEKWRVMKEAEEKKQGNNSEKRIKNRIQGWSEKVRLRLARAESAPTTPSKGNIVKRDGKKVRRNLLEDLARQLGSDEDDTNELLKGDANGNGCSDDNDNDNDNSPIFSDPPSPNEEATTNNNNHEIESERSSVASNLSVDENEIVEENNEESCRSISSHTGEGTVPLKTEQSDDFRGKVVANFRERKLLSGKFQWLWKFGKNIAGGGGGEGSVVEKGGTSDGTKASSINGYGDDNNNNNNKDKCNGVSSLDGTKTSSINGYDDDNNDKIDKCDGVSSSDGRKASSINGYDDDNNDNDKCNGVSSSDGRKASSINGYDDDNNDNCNGVSSSSSMVDGSNDSLIIKGDAVDQNVMVTLRNLGHSMLENIQVIESVFQQDRCGQIQTASPQDNLSKSDLVGRGQVTAMAALKELRKISNLLSEM